MIMCACHIQVYSMDSIPLKMPQGAPQTVNEDVEVTLPDYLRILQETEVSFYVSITVRLRVCVKCLHLCLHVCLRWNSHLNFSFVCFVFYMK